MKIGRYYLLCAVLGFLLSAVPHGFARAEEAHTAAEPATSKPLPSDQSIRELLSDRMQHNGVGIVVGLISPEGRRVVSFGVTDTDSGRTPDARTIFQIGSLTKVFTSLLLADMALRGEVKLDDPAAKYLPQGVSMPQRGRPITLFDLATHSSGLPSMPTNFSLAAKPNPYEAYSEQQLYAFLSTYTPEFEAGTKSEYSNLGAALLGRLLAARAGVEYETLLRERILKPLRMRDTAIALSRKQLQRLAPGHDRYLQPVETWNLTTLPASGALRSTVNDMLTFLGAYLGFEKTSLAKAMQYQRTTRHPLRASQALGWGVFTLAGTEVYLHDGGKEGYRSAAVINPRDRTGIVVLASSRSDDRPLNLALHLLIGRALGPAPRAPVRVSTAIVPSTVLDAYAGDYQVENRVLTLARKDHYLLADMRGNGILRFYPRTATEYFSNTEDEELLFQSTEVGAQTLVLRRSGRDIAARRINTRE